MAKRLVVTEVKTVIAMLDEIRQARVQLAACRELVLADLDIIPDDVLREATNDLFEIREIAGELYDPIAFEIANNELAEIAAEEASIETEMAESVAALRAPTSPGVVSDEQGASNAEGPSAHHNPRSRAEALLKRAYASFMCRVRNGDREKPVQAEFRQRDFAEVDSLVAALDEGDRVYLSQLEEQYQTRGRRLHEQLTTMLKFEGLPGVPYPDARCSARPPS